MALESDIKLSTAIFDPAYISKQTAEFNERLLELSKQEPGWYEVGAAEFRRMRLAGETVFPRPTILEQGKDIIIPSRQTNRSIPCRLFYPETINKWGPPVKGVMMHIHGGGWVLFSHLTSDPLLQDYANKSSCAVISVGYRLAPEHPFPAGPEDCLDVAEYLVDTAETMYGAPLRFITGESAGAHLSILASIKLLHTRRTFSLSGGLLLHFGVFDLSISPSGYTMSNAPVLPLKTLNKFIEAFIPSRMLSELKSADISPIYTDLEEFRGALPAALFTCGTMDPLLDDTVLMSTRWSIAGGAATTKFYTGAVHGFLSMGTAEGKRCLEDTWKWIADAM